jgi:hypothetical protein
MSYLATQKGLTVEAIRQVKADWGREQRLANYLESVLPWSLTPTPAFYFTDYHINKKLGQGRESYIDALH